MVPVELFVEPRGDVVCGCRLCAPRIENCLTTDTHVPATGFKDENILMACVPAHGCITPPPQVAALSCTSSTVASGCYNDTVDILNSQLFP